MRCPSGKVLVLLRYYEVIDWSSGVSENNRARAYLRVCADLICVENVVPVLYGDLTPIQLDLRVATATSNKPLTKPGAIPASGASFQIDERAHRHEIVGHIQEAAGDWLADGIDDSILKRAFAAETWSLPVLYPPGTAAQVLSDQLDTLNHEFSAGIQAVAQSGGIPASVAAAGAGIGTDMMLQPIQKPVEQATNVVMLAGMMVGMLVGQPMLIAACAKIWAHNKLKDTINGALTDLLKALSSTDSPRMGTVVGSGAVSHPKAIEEPQGQISNLDDPAVAAVLKAVADADADIASANPPRTIDPPSALGPII